MFKGKKNIIIFYSVIIITLIGILLISYKQLSYSPNVISKSNRELYNIASIILGILSIGLTSLIYFLKKINSEKLFIIIMPFLCMFFMIFMPPFTSHDESHHWVRAYEISEGHFITPIKNDKIGSELPKSVIKNINKKYSEITYKDVKKFSKVRLNKDEKSSTDMSTVAIYSPVQYIPQAIGIFIARIFTDKVMYMFYAARLSNIIFCLFILYHAIKIMPIGKKVMLLPLMLPITIEGISSLSADGFTNSIVYFFVALIFNEMINKDDKLKKSTMILISFLAIILALTKIVYIPLVFLIFLIPKNKFKNVKNKWMILSFIALIAIVVNVGWLLFANNTYLSISSSGESTDKIAFILNEPFEYIKLLLVTLNRNFQRYISTLFGSVLGWKEFPIYYIVTYMYFIFFLFLSTTDATLKGKVSKKVVITIFLLLLLIFALIFTSLFVQYVKNHVNTETIYGIQGRYFVPILPLISILLSKLKIYAEYKEESIHKTMGIMSALAYTYIYFTIIIVHL